MTDDQPDFVHIASVLEDHHVDHVLVGGASARFRGAQRPTNDVDSVVAQDPSNLSRVAAALTELGACLRVVTEFPGESNIVKVRITPDLLAQGQTQWWTPHGNIDILPYIDSPAGPLTYDDMRPRADVHEVDGVTITLASLADVIASKTHSGRPKDLEALDELLEIRRRDEGLDRPAVAPPRDLEGPDLGF